MRITLLQSGNRVRVDSTSPAVMRLLQPQLTFVSRQFLYGFARRQALAARAKPYTDETHELFLLDVHGRLIFPVGFLSRVTRALTAAGWDVVHENITVLPRPRAYEPDWEGLYRDTKEFRYKQEEALAIVAACVNGQFDCPPGWGKSTLIRMICRLFPRAQIIVTTKNKDVLRKRLFPELSLNLPSVGMIGGGEHTALRRVMCITMDSLHKADAKADIVLCDECHQAPADRSAYRLAQFRHARMYGFSGSVNMRMDDKNPRCEALFGPVRMRIPYAAGVREGIIVPIQVVWHDVIMDINPCENSSSDAKDRTGVWRNTERNRIIADTARQYGPDVQVLITVSTIDHQLHLKKLLPGFTIVHADGGMESGDYKKYANLGLLPDNFVPITQERRDRLTQRFEEGKLKRVIATGVWNVGVDFKNLGVLIRADAGGSAINDIQIPGRVSRTSDGGKAVGVVHDFLDQFDRGFRRKAVKRCTDYESHGWEQILPRGGKQSLLREAMEWDSM